MSSTEFVPPWSEQEDRLLWDYYEMDKKNDSTEMARLLERFGYTRSPIAIRSRIFKLRRRGYGDVAHVQRLAVNLPWR